MKARFAILVLLSAAACGQADELAFARYQPILDKQPFGKEPPEAEMQQSAAAQSFARDIRLSMLFAGADGTVRAGIEDNSTRKNYILCIGEPQAGFELVEANIEANEATIRRNSEKAILKLVAGSSQPAASKAPPVRSSPADRRRDLRQKIADQKQPAQQPQEEPVQPLTGEELRRHLEEVQMDAIRTGKPPLPMQLTPEMDAQLVAEGLLEPQ
jgi:hypothetical protein